MSGIDPIASVAAEQLSRVLPQDDLVAAPPAQRGAETSFGKLVSDGLAQVNQQLVTSNAELQQLATGEAQNLHQVMIRLEESRLSFQLMMQVRSRLLEAYQDIMKMQV